MDTWKLVRLSVCLAVMLTMLAVGGYARMRWGVPENPYGGYRASPYNNGMFHFVPITVDPFLRLQQEMDPQWLFGPEWLRSADDVYVPFFKTRDESPPFAYDEP